MSKQELNADALKVPCAWCGEHAGDPCKSKLGSVVQPHRRRIRAGQYKRRVENQGQV